MNAEKKIKFKLDPETGTLSEADAKRYFSTVGAAVFALVLISQLGAIGLAFTVAAVAPAWLESGIISNLLSVVTLYGLGFPAFYAILRRLPRDTVQPEKMGGKSFFGALCVSIAAMMAGNYLSQILIITFEQAMGGSLQNPVEAATEGTAWWVNLIFVGLLAPIMEELVFRKILCDRLLPLGEGYTVVLSAVIFGLAHGNFFQFFYAFALGLLFALIYVKTGRIRYTIAYHAIINIMGGVLAPWLLDRLGPLLEEEALERMTELSNTGDIQALSEMMSPYLVPMMILGMYEIFLIGGSIVGIILFFKGKKQIRLERGLLPPPRKGRIANIFCNVGVAAALTAFTALFLLSLLPVA